MDFNLEQIRADFPILHQKVYGKPLVYLDNAATTQKPISVINALSDYYSNYNSNIHRGVHILSEKATSAYEKSRKIIADFIGANSDSEVIFTRGATESINLIAQTYGRENLQAGDEILLSQMEHHANIVPWQILAQQTGAIIKVIPIDDNGDLLLDDIDSLMTEKMKIFSITHVSNALGTINDVKPLIARAKSLGALTILDACQSVQHFSVDVKELDCDFLAFSGHKLYAPTGIGILWGRKALLEAMPPYQSGGDMILTVSFEKTVYNEVPFKFEAGTPNISGAIGLAEAINYIQSIGLGKIAEYEMELTKYAHSLLEPIDGLRIIGNARNKTSVVSFVLDNVHPHDVGTLADQDGVALRTGHHCAEPVMKRYKIPATTRASIAFYNTREELEIFAESIKKIIRMFA